MEKLHRALSKAKLMRPSSSPLGVLDGGQGTHLSTLGVDITSSLFGTALLASSDPVDFSMVKRLHKDYLSAGAQIVGTLTYQLADLACEKAGWSRDEIVNRRAQMWNNGIKGAYEAREEWIKEQENKADRPLISLALGPYGACLANGAEYTGNYESLSYSELVHFHKDRILSAMNSPAFQSTVDLIAFETIPRLDEADAILTALEELYQENQTRLSAEQLQNLPPVYISFVFPLESKGLHLPHPSGQNDQTKVKDIVRLIYKRKSSIHWPIAGIGVNCTKTNILKTVVDLLTEEASAEDVQPLDRLHLFLYPDGGLVWDAVNRCWLDPSSGKRTSEPPSAASWAHDLYNLASTAAQSDVWAGIWVGGCCMTGPREIQELAKLVSAQ